MSKSIQSRLKRVPFLTLVDLSVMTRKKGLKRINQAIENRLSNMDEHYEPVFVSKA